MVPTSDGKHRPPRSIRHEVIVTRLCVKGDTGNDKERTLKERKNTKQDIKEVEKEESK